jgi:hypothetical protein
MTRSIVPDVAPPPLASTSEPSELAYHDPAWLVQRAWSVYRLARLQELIRLTISDLHAISLPDVPSSQPAKAANGDPVAEALRACCEELRDASGMLGAEEARAQHCRAVRDYMAQRSTEWADTFTHALHEYRKAASRRLEIALV